MRSKVVITVQAVVIAILLSLLLFQYFNGASYFKTQTSNYSSVPQNSLISPRLYTGLIEPKSYLIVNFVPLKKELQAYIKENNLTMSIYVVNLRNGASMSINSYRPFPPASLSKVPIAMLMMRKVEEGELTMNTPLEIEDADKVDSSGTLYLSSAKTLPLKTLIEQMLQKSDNTAFKVLLRHLQKDDEKIINTYWDYFSTDTTPEPEQEYGNGVITSRSVYNVFLSLYLSTILEPEHSEYLLNLMTNTTFEIKKIAQLPAEINVVHKFGLLEENRINIFHDCGIMYIQEMRMFYCVMTSNNENQNKGIQHVGYAVNKIFNYVVETRKSLDAFKENPDGN